MSVQNHKTKFIEIMVVVLQVPSELVAEAFLSSDSFEDRNNVLFLVGLQAYAACKYGLNIEALLAQDNRNTIIQGFIDFVLRRAVSLGYTKEQLDGLYTGGDDVRAAE